MRRRRVFIGLVVVAIVAVVAALWPDGPSKDAERNLRLRRADRTIRVGMTAAAVTELLGCEPDERADDGSVERWTTRGHLGHTVTVEYESGRVKHVEGRTWRSRPEPSWWDGLVDRLGL
jgi:hypothetical protein